MTPDPRLGALRRLPDLAPYTDPELAGLLPYLDEVRVGAGVRLATWGQFADQWLLVLEGVLEACGAAGRRRLEAGDSAGWSAMWERGTNAETLVAASNARLLVMSRAQFRAVAALGRRERPAAAVSRVA